MTTYEQDIFMPVWTDPARIQDYVTRGMTRAARARGLRLTGAPTLTTQTHGVLVDTRVLTMDEWWNGHANEPPREALVKIMRYVADAEYVVT